MTFISSPRWLIALINLVCSLAAYGLARRKRLDHPFGAFLLGGVIGPLAILHVITERPIGFRRRPPAESRDA
jgi:hypothetical protein